MTRSSLPRRHDDHTSAPLSSSAARNGGRAADSSSALVRLDLPRHQMAALLTICEDDDSNDGDDIATEIRVALECDR